MKLNTALIALLLIVASCSSDDGVGVNTQNKLTIGKEEYLLQSLQIRNENGAFPVEPAADIEFSLTNKTFAEIDGGGNLSDILDVYFDYKELELEEGEYTQIIDYNIHVGGSLVNGNYTRGEEVIDDFNQGSMLQSASVRISNLSESSITIEFDFVREDGLEISGFYSGTYRKL